MMRQKLYFFAFIFIYGCSLPDPGGDYHTSTQELTTRIHKPMTYTFQWQEDSLVAAYSDLTHYAYAGKDDNNVFYYLRYGAYEINSKGINDSLIVKNSSRIDSILFKIFTNIDSTHHLEFSLTDSTNTDKSYDVDLTPVFSYINYNDGKHYEIRGDSIDIFLPKGNFYVNYYGSCYNGTNNFSDMTSETRVGHNEGFCLIEKTPSALQTITLEIAALHRMFFSVQVDFENQSSLETDTFSFIWQYEI